MGAFSKFAGASSANAGSPDGAANGVGSAGGGAEVPVAPDIGWRVQQILDDAMHVAAEIRDAADRDAEELMKRTRDEAMREIEERVHELGEITRSLAARSERLQREIDALDDAIGEAAQRLDPPMTAQAPSVTTEALARSEAVNDRAVRFATQMAAAGSARVAIERALRNDFGIDKPTALVDRVLS